MTSVEVWNNGWTSRFRRRYSKMSCVSASALFIAGQRKGINPFFILLGYSIFVKSLVSFLPVRRIRCPEWDGSSFTSKQFRIAVACNYAYWILSGQGGLSVKIVHVRCLSRAPVYEQRIIPIHIPFDFFLIKSTLHRLSFFIDAGHIVICLLCPSAFDKL